MLKKLLLFQFVKIFRNRFFLKNYYLQFMNYGGAIWISDAPGALFGRHGPE